MSGTISRGKLLVEEEFGQAGKPLGQIIKRRIRFHEPALKALTICIVFVFTGIFLRFSTPLSIPK